MAAYHNNAHNIGSIFHGSIGGQILTSFARVSIAARRINSITLARIKRNIVINSSRVMTCRARSGNITRMRA